MMEQAVAPNPVGAARRGVQWLLLAAPALGLAVLGFTHRFITDDGFIYFRVVQQILAGNGPVFNAGQRVEAFTSPLWVLVLTVADRLAPIRLEYLAVGLGILGTAGGLALATVGSARLVRARYPDALLVPVGALVPLAVAPMWFFATSGLETGLVFAWIGACAWTLARWARSDDRLAAWGAALLGLGWLVRPDLLVLSLAFAIAVVAASWKQDRWRDRLRLLAFVFALPLAYQLFRMGYYASILPNTAIAKEASRARWDSGWKYLRQFSDAYELWIPMLLLAVGIYVPLVLQLRRGGQVRALWTVGAFVVGAGLQAAYVVRVGGDYFPARLLLPALFAVCAPVAVVPVRREFGAGVLVACWALVCGLVLRPPFGLSGGSTVMPLTVEGRGWGVGGRERAWYRGSGVYYSLRRLDVRPAAGLDLPTAAEWGIGMPAYALGPRLDVLDLLGLADPFTAHLEVRRRGFPGHEKPLPSPWSAARLTAVGTHPPASDFPQSQLIPPLIPSTTGAAFDAEVEWARAALRCPGIRELERAATRPLTVGRFLSNVLDSFHLTRVSIPPDPKQAYRKFCGPGGPNGR